MKWYFKVSAILIALYIGVENATNGGKLISSGASGASTVIKTFQGR